MATKFYTTDKASNFKVNAQIETLRSLWPDLRSVIEYLRLVPKPLDPVVLSWLREAGEEVPVNAWDLMQVLLDLNGDRKLDLPEELQDAFQIEQESAEAAAMGLNLGRSSFAVGGRSEPVFTIEAHPRPPKLDPKYIKIEQLVQILEALGFVRLP
jgi:hypothetical protein